jgi:hypothetical protein
MEHHWKELQDEGKYKPKFPDSPFVHIADLVNPDTNKTYREENAELAHNIPMGALVEHKDTGVRLFVVKHSRDCDMTPLYCLAVDKDDTIQERPNFHNHKWHGGYTEESLEIIDD